MRLRPPEAGPGGGSQTDARAFWVNEEAWRSLRSAALRQDRRSMRDKGSRWPPARWDPPPGPASGWTSSGNEPTANWVRRRPRRLPPKAASITRRALPRPLPTRVLQHACRSGAPKGPTASSAAQLVHKTPGPRLPDRPRTYPGKRTVVNRASS